MKKTKDSGILPPAELLSDGDNTLSSGLRKTRRAALICKAVVAVLFLVTLLIGLFLPVTQQRYVLKDTEGNELWSRTYDYSATQGVIGTVTYLTTFNKAPSEKGTPANSVEEEVAAIRKNAPSAFERAGYLQSYLLFEEENMSEMYKVISGSVSKAEFEKEYTQWMAKQLEIFGGEVETANLLGVNEFIELHNARHYRADGAATQTEQKIIDDEMSVWFAENAAKYLVGSYEWSPELSMAINELSTFYVTDADGIYYLYKKTGAWEGSTWKSDGGGLNRRGGIGSVSALCYNVLIFIVFIASFIQFVIVSISLIKSLKNGESARMKRLDRGYTAGFVLFLAAAIIWAIADSMYFKNMFGDMMSIGFLLNASAIVCMVFSVLSIAAVIVYNIQLKKMKTIIDEWLAKQIKN